MLRLQTRRLELVAADEKVLQADLAGRKALGIALECTVPTTWPPVLWEKAALELSLEALRYDPSSYGWLTWYFLLREERRPVAIGFGGFKGGPGKKAEVELGYTILSEFQRQGYATEAIEALVAWAFNNPDVMQVVAETLPELVASIRLLEKLRFARERESDGAVRFVLKRNG